MTDTINFREQAIHAELAAAAYNRNPSTGVAGGHDLEHMDSSLFERYDVRVEGAGAGEVVYLFTDLESGKIYVVGRGTDDFGPNEEHDENSPFGDASQYPGIGTGAGTDLGVLMASVATDIHSSTGQQVTVIGHSYGGHAAHEAAIRSPEAIDTATNIQGPAVIEFAGPLLTPLGAKDLHNAYIAGTATPSITHIVASHYDDEALGYVQRALDIIGAGGDYGRVAI